MDTETRPATKSATEPSRVSFDQLDTMVRVTTVQGWMYLALLFAIGVGSIVFAVLFQVPTKVIGEGILLTERDTLVRVRARATGRLLVLQAHLGDQVEANALIGQIAQEDLEDRIHQDDERLADLRREDDELTRFEEAERESKEAAILRVR